MSEPHTTVPQFLALCAAGDPEADARLRAALHASGEASQ